ncbi:hypothetical protein [Microbacterium hydrocarbonoxydans]|uniref:hypothetical protein n=1 Tax=Microbacterium hydrocarbonoxydans TaxID=273678 RepID=UPI0013DA8FAF|nr:hypothetical protein [Microbacterium hydrocarbonoxydans]
MTGPHASEGRRAHDDDALPADADRNENTPAGDVPAGGAGADSGAVESVRIDPDDEAAIPDRSPHNDEPGVGTRDGRRRDTGA